MPRNRDFKTDQSYLMLSKSTIKYINALKRKKFRQRYDNFIAEGNKIALEILRQSHFDIHSIFATQDWADLNHRKLSRYRDILTIVEERELKSISSLTTPNKVVIILKKPKTTIDEELISNNLSLVLDGIQDPGNLGTIWRIADWFGIEYLFCSENCVDLYNPKVIQSSMGAFLRVKAVELNIPELFSQRRELPVYGAVLGGKSIYQTPLKKHGFLVIGNESKGISEAMSSAVTHPIGIPSSGGAESLNAAVATGIICSWFQGSEVSRH